MPLLTTSFGKYASLPMGWILMVLVVVAEVIIISEILSRRTFNPRILLPVSVSNIASGLAGAFVSKTLNEGWMLVVWFPWVSSVEVNPDSTESLAQFVVYFVAAFIGTLIIEVLINGLLMKSRGFKNVMRATIIANVITYLVACFILYTYSFIFYN